MSQSIQVWVRNEQGRVYGPLTPASVELLIDHGVVGGRLEVSTDGFHYVLPGMVPGLRTVFPRESWGETIVPGDELDAQWNEVKVAKSVTPGERPILTMGGQAPKEGPGATPVPRIGVSSSGSGLRSVPGPATLRDSRMPSSGVLGPVSALQLYVYAAAGELTGLLTVKVADRELVVHFKKGNPEYLDSTHSDDALAMFLLAQKLATVAQLDAARAQSDRFGGELLAALFGLGLLNPNAVFGQLGQRASGLLFKVLTAEQGSFSFENRDFPSARSLPLGNKWAVYLEALRRVSGAELRRRLQGALDLPVMKGEGPVGLTDLRLTPQETRALTHFDGVRSLNQLARDFPAETDTMLRTAWMLAPLDIVSFAAVTLNSPKAETIGRAGPPQKMTAPQSGPPKLVPAPTNVNSPKTGIPTVPSVLPPGSPVVPPVPVAPTIPAIPAMPPAIPPVRPVTPVVMSIEEDIRQMQALFEQMKKQNLFQVLGVGREAEPASIKMAYLKAARSYHPDTVAQGSPEALGRVKADIFNLISDANRTLSDPVLRKHYAAELEAGGTGSKVDVEKILRGEEVFQKGRILVQARRYPEALKMFEEAVSCNPDEGEFYAWRGYAKLLVGPDRQAVLPQVMNDLNWCVKLNPNVASAYYFLGFVAKGRGDEKAALAHFAKCVSIDPKHIDAQRELRSPKRSKE